MLQRGYSGLCDGTMADHRRLLGPAGRPLRFQGQVHVVIQCGDRNIEEVFIVKNLTTHL